MRTRPGTLVDMDPRGPQTDDEQFAEFFDDRRLFGSGRRLPRLRLPTHPVERRDWIVAVSLLVVSVIAAAVMRVTSDGLQDEISESPVFPWTWILGPLLCGIASAVRPFAGRPLWWAVSLLGPWLAVVAVEGLVLFDPWRGASFWGLYAVAIVVQGVVCWTVGGVAALVANRRTAFAHHSL